MCDALSMLSAGADLAGGFIGAKEARSRGRFDAAMMDVQMILNTAQTRQQQGQLYREFEIVARQNIAAAGVSGLAAGSFDAVAKGNYRDLMEATGDLENQSQVQKIGMQAAKAEALAAARMEAATSMFSGISSATFTLAGAEQSYREANTGQTRLEYFKGSWT